MTNNDSKITLHIGLGEDKIPNKIQWESEGKNKTIRDADAFMLHVWDKEDKGTYNIELWTKDMLLDDMNLFYFQTLMTMSETYKRASNDPEMAAWIKDFAIQFGEKLKLIQMKE